MASLDGAEFAAWRKVADSLGRDGFAKTHPHLFLVRHPTGAGEADEDSGPIRYRTLQVPTGEDPFGATGWVAPLRKRPGNPYSDWLSVGRTTNCDVVLRLPFISKLHAQILLKEDGERTLADQRSANGTRHNGRKLDPGERVPIAAGDRLGFGAVEFVILDAWRTYDALLDADAVAC